MNKRIFISRIIKDGAVEFYDISRIHLNPTLAKTGLDVFTFKFEKVPPTYIKRGGSSFRIELTPDGVNLTPLEVTTPAYGKVGKTISLTDTLKELFSMERTKFYEQRFIAYVDIYVFFLFRAFNHRMTCEVIPIEGSDFRATMLIPDLNLKQSVLTSAEQDTHSSIDAFWRLVPREDELNVQLVRPFKRKKRTKSIENESTDPKDCKVKDSK